MAFHAGPGCMMERKRWPAISIGRAADDLCSFLPSLTAMIATALVFLTLCGITIAAVLAFSWAAKNGQFRDQNAAARAVFDPDEPEGEATDAFPGLHPPAASEEQPDDHR
jgi:cbb3-type cytochrome oxidase maturation protein